MVAVIRVLQGGHLKAPSCQLDSCDTIAKKVHALEVKDFRSINLIYIDLLKLLPNFWPIG